MSSVVSVSRYCVLNLGPPLLNSNSVPTANSPADSLIHQQSVFQELPHLPVPLVEQLLISPSRIASVIISAADTDHYFRIDLYARYAPRTLLGKRCNFLHPIARAFLCVPIPFCFVACVRCHCRHVSRRRLDGPRGSHGRVLHFILKKSELMYYMSNLQWSTLFYVCCTRSDRSLK